MAEAEAQAEGQVDVDEEIVDETKSACITQNSSARQRITELILSHQEDVILGAFDKRCRLAQAGQAVMEYARALFHALCPLAREDDTSKAAHLLLLVTLRVLHLVHSERLEVDKKVLDCVAFLSQQMEFLPRQHIPKVVESILAHLQSLGEAHTKTVGMSTAGTLELLPRCLLLLVTSADPVVVCSEDAEDAEERRVSGHVCLSEVVERLATIPWPRLFLMRIVTILRELPVNVQHMEMLLKKVFQHVKEAEPQELPAVVYQLLLLASKGFKRIVLKGLVAFFNKWSTASNPRRGSAGGKHLVNRQIEGTVVLHINFAVKQDPTLGKEWLQLLRAGQSLTPFTVSVLLSISRIPRFEQPAYDILKAAALKAYQDTQHCRESAWASAALGLRCNRTAHILAQSFMRTVESNSFGWDHIIPSVVQIGFMLVESGPTARSALVDTGRISLSGSQELGAQVLTAAFEAHAIARDEIIEQSKCRIIGLKPQNSSPIISMLAQLVQKYPQLMLEHSSRLKECLEYFTFLHSEAASSLIRAFCPLFQLSQDLQDYTVLVLRKAMFSRDAGARMTAVQGIVDLMIADKLQDSDSVPHSASEASCSQSFSQREKKSNSARGFSLLHDLLGLLRRCLSQQAIVRETMYKGLPRLLLVDPRSSEAIFDLVWSHFRRLYEYSESSSGTLKLSSCVKIQDGIVHLEEPVHHLVSCIYQLQLLLGGQGQESAYDFGFTLTPEQEIGKGSSCEALAAAFMNLRQSMQSRSLGDFKLDNTQNFAAETLEGESNVEQARMLLGILEVLMNAAVADLSRQGTEAEKELEAYLTMHDSLEQALTQKPAKGIGKGGPKVVKERAKPASSKSGQFLVPRASIEKRKPLLGNPCIAHLLLVVAEKIMKSVKQQNGSQPAPEVSEGAQQLSAFDCRLASFALRSCWTHLKAVSTDSTEQSEFLSNLHDLTDSNWKILARPLSQLLLALRTCGVNAMSQDIQQEKPRTGKGKKVMSGTSGSLVSTAVKCLDELIRLADQQNCLTDVFRELRLDAELVNEEEPEEEAAKSEQRRRIHDWINQHAKPLMIELLSHSQWEEIQILAGVILLLTRRLSVSQMETHSAWAELLCKEHKVTSPVAATALATMATCLGPPPRDLNIAQALAGELQYVMGSELAAAINSSSNYPILNVSTRIALAGFLLHYAETSLLDVDWLVSTLRQQPDAKAEGTMSGPELARGRQEEALHTRVEAVVSLVSIFTGMTLPGSLAETLLKTAIKLYKCLVATTRLCIAPKGYLQPTPTPKFQGLAEVTCKKLTAPLYAFVAAMQKDPQENIQRKGFVNQIKREARTIPNLIFCIEEYEKYLIQLSKLTKVNLMRHAKRSTARDFKILDLTKQAKHQHNAGPREAQEDNDGVQDNEDSEELGAGEAGGEGESEQEEEEEVEEIADGGQEEEMEREELEGVHPDEVVADVTTPNRHSLNRPSPRSTGQSSRRPRGAAEGVSDDESAVRKSSKKHRSSS